MFSNAYGNFNQNLLGIRTNFEKIMDIFKQF